MTHSPSDKEQLREQILGSFKLWAMQGFSTYQMTDDQLDQWIDDELLRIIQADREKTDV